MTSGSSAKPILKEVSTAAQWEGLTLKHRFEGHKERIWAFIFLHDNIRIVSSSLDGTMRK
ncbi:hypothetical protein BDR07DRAFT_1513104 [Suillus spraguei]|nr:hypothetical protein BDR07DRAFT_1513104 [Suillus spraguei]